MCAFFFFFAFFSLFLSLLIFKGFKGLENWLSKLMDFDGLRKKILRLKHCHGFGKQLSKHKDFFKGFKSSFQNSKTFKHSQGVNSI